MHPQMSQPYIHNDFNLFPHTASHPSQPLGSYHYDNPNYDHDPFPHFDTAKPINQFQYIQPPYQHTQQLHQQHQYPQSQQYPQTHPQYQQNQFNLSPYPQQNLYQQPQADIKRHRPTNSVSSEDSVPTPTFGRPMPLRAPKFDRTYTDALEDELYDESSSSQSVASQSPSSRMPAPGFQQQRMNAYHGQMGAPNMPPSVQHVAQKQPQRVDLPSQPAPQQSMLYPQSRAYDPLGNRQDSQSVSSTAVADSVRRLQAPNRTTVSPREAFLDYPDSADFRERKLFSKSASPLSQNNELSHTHQSESSNEEDYDGSDGNTLPVPSAPYSLHSNTNSLSVPATRSNSESTRHSGPFSGNLSAASGDSSESEYDPTAVSSRRASRSSARSSTLAKSFACPDCGKRFEKSHPLQAHRRNSHGKGSGPPALTHNKFSNTSHRCDWVDPSTGKVCNTVFSRPYDLIRHYETKHSAKRQEFICPHCEDRKSFSRSDALRRHLRVKHPSSGRK